ncbi:symmetrical bis(5'-nucleosyl)-tetraphosphatase [Psychromonas sp. PT13]|uniref:symmetrical bis(5'-nucleosyl)-tetraphosphatase n=1 Tax=Psychromonas sp. PT13 TaxID=3439547 RepID=UPI003EC0C97E
MATYIIGDIHGCYDELQSLLTQAQFNQNTDELWFTGDLITRGPKSLETLRFIKGLGDTAKIVLGNHDLHLLSINEGIFPNHKKDNLTPIFEAPDCNTLLTWLRFQPLMRRHPAFKFALVHAGVYPRWSLKKAEKLAKEIEVQLQSENYKQLLIDMYGGAPCSWSNNLTGIKRMRFIINAFTRMRYCLPDGSLDFKNKLSPEQTNNANLTPWYEAITLKPNRSILFGHWASLMGKVNKSNIYGLDTGCVWGNSLTMLRWEDKKYFSVPSTIK